MAISRRQFCEGLMIGGALGGAIPAGARGAVAPQPAPADAGSHLGNLYPFVQGQADRSTFELSFLRDEFKDLRSWQRTARARVFDHLFYAPPKVDPKPELIRRTDRGDYVEEYLTFQTTPDLRIPAYVLLPKQTRIAAPGLLVLHSHDGIYLWGKEKVVAVEQEHPYLTTFKQERYGGKSIASELARRGYVTMAIDMFYWGERRMLLRRRPAVVSRAAGHDERRGHSRLQSARGTGRIAGRPQPVHRRHHLAGRDRVG